jgi:sugar fermentation stimulation protein A
MQVSLSGIEEKHLVSATFVKRDNRFRVQVRVEGRATAAHLPNSGRLGELLVPGRNVWLAPIDLRTHPNRRTEYDLALVEYAGRLVSVDARVPGHLVAEALRRGQLAGFTDYTSVRREVRFGQSRIDFRLEAGPEKPLCWMEVKSVTLVEDGTARFPDAPTVRGQRHVRELMDAVRTGVCAVVVFIVQRDDAERFAPHSEADPAFAHTLRQAAHAGVEVHAWRCHVSHTAVRLADRIPVALWPDAACREGPP